MRQSGFRAWKVLGGLTAALLGAGCGLLPDTGGRRPNDPPQTILATEVHHVPSDFYERFQYSPNRGYNGTIRDIGSSIDPRTPKKQGESGQSRLLDVTGRPAPSTSDQGVGGSGNAGAFNETNDMGWRARRGYEVEPAGEFGPYGEGYRQ